MMCDLESFSRQKRVIPVRNEETWVAGSHRGDGVGLWFIPGSDQRRNMVLMSDALMSAIIDRLGVELHSSTSITGLKPAENILQSV